MGGYEFQRRFRRRQHHLIEISRNYFAQTEAGTVCYFGENVNIYEDGRVVSNDGSWRADGRRGLPGLAPGIFMSASPKPGMHFQQEVAPGVAEDEATIVGTGSVATPRNLRGDDQGARGKADRRGQGLQGLCKRRRADR
jgi:hypothetical protein